MFDHDSRERVFKNHLAQLAANYSKILFHLNIRERFIRIE